MQSLLAQALDVSATGCKRMLLLLQAGASANSHIEKENNHAASV
jgi:hypothetical protein